jgi:CRISPR-associated protein Cas1
MNDSYYRTARALYPHRPEMWEPEFLYEPLPIPVDHPELFDLLDVATSELPVEGDLSQATPIFTEPLQARMLNEFVYCPRLFYYEHVEGVFLESADTERGSAIHKKVDKGRGDLPSAKKKAAEVVEQADESGGGLTEVAQTAETDVAAHEVDTIHSRSATLGSERLGVLAKMDLIEVQMVTLPQNQSLWQAPEERGESSNPISGDACDGLTKKIAKKKRAVDAGPDLFAVSAQSPNPEPQLQYVEIKQRVVQKVTPVDYKIGSPRRREDGNEIWDADKMQLGLQILILRDNGYTCDEGVIYYRGTKQRVLLPMTAELEVWIMDNISAARLAAASPTIPPPLESSPKCVRCSLAPVCLPDETRLLKRNPEPASLSRTLPNLTSPRRLIAARDDERALYLNTQGARATLRGEVLVVKEQDQTLGEFRLKDISHVSLFGNIQITTQSIQTLCEAEIPIAYFSMGGWFYGLTRGHGLKNVFTRIQQFQTADDPKRCLALAQRFVNGKIRNHRTQLMRNHINLPENVSLKLKRAAGDVLEARSLNELLGMEGAAAAMYFQNFAGMIKVNADDDELPGLESAKKADRPDFTFDFTTRKRRPPTDAVNALLSLAYSLLAKDCMLAAYAVGFDPYIGFFHQPRHGRPALALDLMEEFRPLIAESAVLTALNNRMVNPGHFVRAGDAVNLTTHGRKAFFQAYEQRMSSLVTHPIFDYKASYRRVLELQARMLARYLTGEIREYVPMMTR